MKATLSSVEGIEKADFSFIVQKRYQLKRAVSQLDDAARINYAKTYIQHLLLGFDSQEINSFSSFQDAFELGRYLSKFPYDWSCYFISTIYTSLLPDSYRSSNGIFYTPPILVDRLLDTVESNGVNWADISIIDPSCGGGAFLTPIAKRIVECLDPGSPKQIEHHLKNNLKGYDIDPFGAWLSQEFLRIYLQRTFLDHHFDLEGIVECKDSLGYSQKDCGSFDLVIGNPPYGKVSLTKEEREKWNDSLYGHANYYGLFAHLGIKMLRESGRLAYVMPSSFLGGKYFKKLRSFLLKASSPTSIDFISSREGVFPDVLQEVCLMHLKKEKTIHPTLEVNFLDAFEFDTLKITPGGSHSITSADGSPWLIPRNLDQVSILNSLEKLPLRLKDLGYKVSTGPLVWNRHKDQLSKEKTGSAIPIVWAECLHPNQNGAFIYKCQGRNHYPFYRPTSDKDPNIVNKPCILVQRTTALEQKRRLVCAIMPEDFLRSYHQGVSVENHLNMILQVEDNPPRISMETINFLLNSPILDSIFRCINGSAAVSAYEIEALPLPKLDDLLDIERLFNTGKVEEANELLLDLYL